MSKIDAGTLQDLHHYALAIRGNGDSTFPSDTLTARLAAVDSAYYCLTNLNESEDMTLWEPLIREAKSFKSEAELLVYGQSLGRTVGFVSSLLRIDPHSGEKLS